MEKTKKDQEQDNKIKILREKVENHIKEKPIPYIVGATAFGSFLLGYLLGRRK